MQTTISQRISLAVAMLWLAASALLLAMDLLTDAYRPGLWTELYCGAVTVLSPVTFLVYGWDKWKSGHDGRRIPEKSLHLLAFLGGWPGAVAGQRWFRHKTVKPTFRAILTLIAVLHIAAVLFLGLNGFSA